MIGGCLYAMRRLWGRPCGSCHWRRTPGLNDLGGYCAGRDDLPLVYGLLHYPTY